MSWSLEAENERFRRWLESTAPDHCKNYTLRQWACRAHNPDNLPHYKMYFDRAFDEHPDAQALIVVSRKRNEDMINQDPASFSFYQWRVAYIDEEAWSTYAYKRWVAFIKYDYQDPDLVVGDYQDPPIWVCPPTDIKVIATDRFPPTAEGGFVQWAAGDPSSGKPIEDTVHDGYDAEIFTQQDMYRPSSWYTHREEFNDPECRQEIIAMIREAEAEAHMEAQSGSREVPTEVEVEDRKPPAKRARQDE
jgi:hypothetical protein